MASITGKYRILFVCRGNTCRSPMAEAWFRELCRREDVSPVEVKSVGLCTMSGGVQAPVRVVLMEEGVDIGNFSSSPLTVERVKNADLVVAMTRQQRQMIVDLVPEAADKAQTLLSFAGRDGDIDDPYGGDTYAYRLCLQAMKPAMRALLDNVRQR